MNVEPLVSIVRGTPTDLELTALVTVVAARSTAVDASPDGTPPDPARTAWTRSARPSMGPASWRTSALPH
jgi:acyl-CoA carboxylase epsilon subunit